MTPAIIGGILLIIGAFFVSQGEIFKSVFAYFIADIVWITLAIQAGDIIGAILIIIGGILGIVAFIKMNSGQFHKSIKKS